MSPISPTHRFLSARVRNLCLTVFIVGSFLPPYVPKAALAPEDGGLSSQQFLMVEDGFIKKTSPLTRQGARRAYAKGTIHVVKEGDSLERLSRWYQISVDTIRWANNLQAGTPIRPGDELLILPTDGVLHTVSRGQTLSRIAELYDIDTGRIMEQNELRNEFILAGQQLVIPGGRPIIEKPTIASADPKPSTPTTTTPKPTPSRPQPATPAPTDIAAPTAGVLQKPCDSSCYYTQYYHGGHYAVDMQDKSGGKLGGPIYAAEAGTVIRAETGWNGGYGNVVEVDHGNGLITLYGHNDKIYVKVGDQVERGQNIATMGNTGLVYGATGIHVHFEVQVNGVKKNPLLYLE